MINNLTNLAALKGLISISESEAYDIKGGARRRRRRSRPNGTGNGNPQGGGNSGGVEVDDNIPVDLP